MEEGNAPFASQWCLEEAEEYCSFVFSFPADLENRYEAPTWWDRVKKWDATMGFPFEVRTEHGEKLFSFLPGNLHHWKRSRAYFFFFFANLCRKATAQKEKKKNTKFFCN